MDFLLGIHLCSGFQCVPAPSGGCEFMWVDTTWQQFVWVDSTDNSSCGWTVHGNSSCGWTVHGNSSCGWTVHGNSSCVWTVGRTWQQQNGMPPPTRGWTVQATTKRNATTHTWVDSGQYIATTKRNATTHTWVDSTWQQQKGMPPPTHGWTVHGNNKRECHHPHVGGQYRQQQNGMPPPTRGRTVQATTKRNATTHTKSHPPERAEHTNTQSRGEYLIKKIH